MAGGWYLGLVGETERNILNIHVVILYELLKKAPCGAFFGMVNSDISYCETGAFLMLRISVVKV